MKVAKDLFSDAPAAYAAFRPDYPTELYETLLAHAPSRERAWDVATGNGQVAAALAPHFRRVDATDLSASQLAQAPEIENVFYSQGRAESSDFPRQSFDLITVAQAWHWFDAPAFWAEAGRVIRPGGAIAIWGYSTLRIAHPAAHQLVEHFYENTVGEWWEPERRILERGYQDLPFPWPRLAMPALQIERAWNIHELCSYIRTWSATKSYARHIGTDPVFALQRALESVLGPNPPPLHIVFPLHIFVGRAPA